MADIFGSATVPAWMERLNDSNEKLFGRIGSSAGLLFGAGMDTLKADPKTGERPSFDQAYTERQMAAQDPLWKLKAESIKGRILSEAAQRQAQFAALKEKNDESAAWLADAPKTIPWLTASPDERAEMATPEVTSKTALNLMQRQQSTDEQLAYRKQIADNTKVYRDAQLENQKWKQEHGLAWQKNNEEWEDGLFISSLDTQANIEALIKKGNGRNKDGSLSAIAKQYIAEDLKRQGRAIPGQRTLLKEAPLTEEQKVKLRDLDNDERDLRKQIGSAREADPEKVSSLEGQLSEVRAMKLEVIGGKPATAPAPKSPTFALDRKISEIKHEANLLTAQGNDKAAKKKLGEINEHNKAWVLDNNGIIIGRDMPEKDRLKALSGLGVGDYYYDETSGEKKIMTQKALDLLRSASTAAPAPAAPPNPAIGSTPAETIQNALGTAGKSAWKYIKSGEWIPPAPGY